MKLPNYEVVDFKLRKFPSILKVPSKPLSFPLAEHDLHDIYTLECKFDNEDNCAGLAAPQIGIAKQIIVFAAPENPELKKWRKDFTQSIDKTIWINPSYEGLGSEMHEDYEGCFSVADVTGDVSRFKKIRYKAYNLEGNLIEGTAEGFLARLIQHEIDHVNGKLFIDYLENSQLMSKEEYVKLREEALKNKEG